VPLRHQLLCGTFADLKPSADEHGVRPEGSQRRRDLEADPCTATGNQGDTIVEQTRTENLLTHGIILSDVLRPVKYDM
jgi:hypothetical protein